MTLAEDARACAVRAPSVSGWSVAEHLEHLLRADRWIVGWIESAVAEGASEPGRERSGGDASESVGTKPEGVELGGKPSAAGYAVLSTGFIPRGRGRAPRLSRPSGLSTAEIRAGLREVLTRVDTLEPRLGEIDAVALTLPHPMLGRFTPARWLRFADIHHAHHAKIIRDILAAGGS